MIFSKLKCLSWCYLSYKNYIFFTSAHINHIVTHKIHRLYSEKIHFNLSSILIICHVYMMKLFFKHVYHWQKIRQILHRIFKIWKRIFFVYFVWYKIYYTVINILSICSEEVNKFVYVYLSSIILTAKNRHREKKKKYKITNMTSRQRTNGFDTDNLKYRDTKEMAAVRHCLIA